MVFAVFWIIPVSFDVKDLDETQREGFWLIPKFGYL